MNENVKRISVDVLVDILGGILLTIATYSFAVPADFPMTGVSGVALIFYQLFGLPVGALTVILNIPIIICCYKTLGKQFYLKSLRSTLITSAVMDILGPHLPLYQGDLILAAICTGVLLGIGYAIIFMRGSSTGGFDFIMMAVKILSPTSVFGKNSICNGCDGNSCQCNCDWKWYRQYDLWAAVELSVFDCIG